MLPLFAGAVLGLAAWETGLLIAVSQLVAFSIRPLAGVVVDRADRSVVAAAGALGLAFGCGLYALSTGLPVALVAAIASGAAGAFLWVAIRSLVGERLPEDSSVFAKLVAAEETGGWLVLVPAILLQPVAGYQWVFVGIAVCCLLAAGQLLSTRHRSTTGEKPHALVELSTVSLRGLGSRLRPMLLAVVITMTAEAAISLLLILHLHRGFGLDVMEVAYVFLPGAIALSVLPPYLHRMVVRFGRRRILMLGSMTSALFAAGLAFAPSTLWIAALWVLSAVAWSAVIPVQQSVIAEAVGQAHLGRGLSLYEAACLAGAFVGSLAAGLLYESGNWLIACLVCAAIIASGAAIIPAAVGSLGVVDCPSPTPAPLTAIPPTTTSQPDPAPVTGESRPPERGDSMTDDQVVDNPRTQAPRRKILNDFALHTCLFATALLIAWIVLPDVPFSTILGFGSDSTAIDRSVLAVINGDVNFTDLAVTALHIWRVIYIIDLLWTAWKILEFRNDHSENNTLSKR